MKKIIFIVIGLAVAGGLTWLVIAHFKKTDSAGLPVGADNSKIAGDIIGAVNDVPPPPVPFVPNTKDLTAGMAIGLSKAEVISANKKGIVLPGQGKGG